VPAANGLTLTDKIIVDEDTMAKTMHRNAAHNLDSRTGITSSKSFLSFTTPHIRSNLNSVGVSMGGNGNDINLSANTLKHIEIDRLMVSPKN
jgi:hypothetical protein